MTAKSVPPTPANWRALLAARPVRNAAAAAEETDDGGVRIGVRKADAWWRRAPWKWAVPGGDLRYTVLDRLGRELWEICDGRTVEEIVEEMARRHRLTFHESRTAVTPLLRELIRRGALAIALSPPNDQVNIR